MRQILIENYYNSPEYLAKLRFKAQVMKEMEADPYIRESKIMDIYAVDVVRFFEDFLLLKFTEFGGQPKPFFLFPYQKRILLKLQEIELSNQDVDLLVDKPRGMGLTWLIAGYFLWRFLFTPNYSTLILSRKEELVDDGTALPDETIFGKIRWMMARLPKYLIPEGYQPKKAKGTTTDSNLKLINPVLGSSITGSSTNSNAGRSGRFSSIMIDECFFIENFLRVYNSMTSVARLKVFISTTVESKVAKDFKDMCLMKDSYVSLTWKDHPFKDQQWYDELVEKAEKMNNPELMREAEVSYSVNPQSQYYPQISLARCEDVSYVRERPLYVSLDVGGKQDLTVLGFWQFNGRDVCLLEAYENVNKPAEWYAPFLNPETLFNPEFYNEFQRNFIQQKTKVWKKPVAFFGELDHTIKRMPTNTSTADVLWKYGIKIQYNQYAIQHLPRHTAMTQLLPRMVFNKNSDAVMKVYDAIATSKYAAMVRTTNENLKPIHGDDGTADRRAMCENLAVNVGRIFRNQREDKMDGDTRSFASMIIKSLRV